MTNELKAGLVGCGSVAQRGILPHLSQANARQKVRLVAVADAVAERARQTSERFDVPHHFASVEEMLAGTDLDMVLVATPIPYHYANALAAIQAGKHVYVQKAMTTTLAQASALLAARDQAGVKLAAAPGFELFPSTAAMREIIRQGQLGQVYVAYTYTMGFGHEHEPIRGGDGALAEIDPTWYYRPGAGPVPDVTVYSLQLITSLLGPVKRVAALANKVNPSRSWKGTRIPIQVADNNVLLLEFASGALATAIGSDCRGSARIPWGGLGIYGSAGALEVTHVDPASGYPLVFEVQADTTRQYTAQLSDQPYLTGEHLHIEEPHLYADIMELADAVLHNRAPRATGEQARHVVEIVEKSRAAVETGTVQLLESVF